MAGDEEKASRVDHTADTARHSSDAPKETRPDDHGAYHRGNTHGFDPGSSEPVYASLPGFADLAREKCRTLDGLPFTHVMRQLYWEDLCHWRYKVCLHYFRMSNPKTEEETPSTSDKSGSGDDAAWQQLSHDLQEYSAAKERWYSFREPSAVPARYDQRSPVMLAARMFATEVYEERYKDQIDDVDAVHEALQAEQQTITAALYAALEETPAEAIRRINERRARIRQLEADDQRVTAQERLAEAFWARFTMALFGGVALIVPMLIMSLHDTKATALATTSVFTLVVAILLAWYMTTAEAKDVIAATAAYAAVLVVFVGTVTQPEQSDDNVNLNPTGLGAGAIAGIVVGAIAGVVCLIFLTLYCFCQPVLNGLLALLGLKRRRRRVDFEFPLAPRTSMRRTSVRRTSASSAMSAMSATSATSSRSSEP